MNVKELLCSAPGTGKTAYCIERFREQILRSKNGIDSRAFFILPNREHAERIQNLVLGRTVPGLFNAHILTIHDFTSKLSGVLPSVRPSDAVRRKILKEILVGASADLGYFSGVTDCEGFVDLWVDTVKEFKSGLLTVRAFEKLSQDLVKKDPLFRSKFKDITVLFKRYQVRLAAMGFREPEDDIAELTATEPSSRAGLVIFDGFYYFSKAQRALIEWVGCYSQRTLVTLTLPENSAERPSLFEYPERTRVFLKETGFIEKKDLFKQNHRTREPGLLHLEKNLFSAKPGIASQPPSSVRLFEAPGVRAEAEMIAREIKRIYRESDVHFSDICVILRSVKTYESIINSVFSELEIPVHIHERKKLIEQGFVLMLYRYLNLTAENWKKEDLLHVMRSSFWPEFSFQAASEIESLAARNNVLEGRDAWEKLAAQASPDGLAVERLRFLIESESALLRSRDAEAFKRNLFQFLNRLGHGEEEASFLLSIQAILQNLARHARPAGDFSAEEFMRELQEALKAGLFSDKPRGRNRVQVYDAVMAMPKEYKVVFVSGLLEKVFPQSMGEDPLLKDEERKVINRNGVVLEERLPRIAGERYFFYMAVTRAKEKLYLTYPLYDADARPALVSFFVEEVKKVFGGALPVSRKDLDDFLPGPAEWETAHEVTRGLSALWRDRAGELAAGEWLERSDFREVLAFGRSDDAAVLRDERVKKILSSETRPFSATRLETYATCSFKYFAAKTLSLNEPPENREAIEIGKALHGVLEEFYKTLDEKERRSGSFLENEDRMKKALRSKLREYMRKSPLSSAPLYRQKSLQGFMGDILDLFVRYEAEDFQKRGFLPAYFEFDFGRKKESPTPCLVIQDKDGDILIEGQIDRIDKASGNDKAIVIDYKTSSRAVSLKERHAKGLELQLPIYLLAVRRLLGLDVLGAELRILKDAKAEGFYRQSERSTLGLGPQKSALSDEEFEKILSETEERIRQYVKRLRSGDISVNSKTCAYCSFSSVCRFEAWKLAYSS